MNPAVRQDKTRPLRRTPILNVVHARTCIVLWRFLRAGFAGVENPLFFKENTRKLFGVQGSSDLQASGH